MKAFYHILIITFALIVSSCDVVRVPAYIKKEFPGVYTSQTLSYYKNVNVDGYYKMYEIINRKDYRTKKSTRDTLNYYFMFFSDGLFVSFYPFNEKQFNDSLECQNGNSKKCFYSCEWGVYSFDEDTIMVIKTHKAASLNQKSSVSFMKFVVVDTNSLKYIESNIIGENFSANNATSGNANDWSIAIFHSLKNKPSSDCWLKKKRWFWKDKAAWKQYKRTN